MAPRRVAADLVEAEDDNYGPAPVTERDDDAPEVEAADDQQDDEGEQPELNEGDQPDDVEQPPRRQVREPDPEIMRRLEASERRAEEAERRATEVQTRYEAQRSAAPAETAEQEAAKLALMTPEQIIDYKVNKALTLHDTRVQQATFGATNAADKSSFDSMAMSNTTLKKIAPDVEKKHAELIRDAQMRGLDLRSVPNRETVATFLLGQRAMKMARDAAPQDQARTRRVAQQTTRPGAGRSDVAAQRRGGQTLEQRLENVAL